MKKRSKQKPKKISKKQRYINSVADIFITIALLVIAVVVIVVPSIQKSDIKTENEQFKKDIVESISTQVGEAIREEVPSLYPDYSSLGELKQLVLVSDFESWTPGSELDPKKISKTIVLNDGSLSKAYVLIKSSIDGKALSRWESIYIQMNYRGGHLLRSKSLPVPPGDITELLFAMDDISYLTKVPYSEQSDYYKTNWLNLFYPEAKVNIVSFISSLNLAKIEEISLFYDCAEQSNCSLSVE